VLVVDDEPQIAKILERGLSGAFSVTCAHDGSTALDTLRSEPPFEVIVCDLMMAPMNGMELYRRATELDPRLAERFLVMTGGAYAPLFETFLAEWPFFVLTKPFSLADAQRLVAATLRRGRSA
jgi:CheY-like chemotaxis protein